jgi:hypothetical protein
MKPNCTAPLSTTLDKKIKANVQLRYLTHQF